ncbi:surfactin synthase thioesterase subunit [Chromohalobacter marismortui]|uniref:Surfactin synthase thioesterase subunit n=1 Tax=Chromohalobacter marismortui TaxID=42055 RepID=A0A4R7NRH8_9GAMM|nr:MULTISPECIES: alpha/beta fold hydrolase [Chromohalobacter]MCI0592386.1 alpha/beta fold hydrolase [Chromohalobacter sp.]TDU23563.1 surfactin synthase thioesterase subunit [Chromohalobacter marismortui]
MQAEPLTLFCLPCAGASATMYLRWKARLPGWIDVQPVELPGRGTRLAEPCVEDFERLASRLCDELRGHGRLESYALFGHSMGALLAYGMTQRLRAAGAPLPRALLASGSPAPARRDTQGLPGKHDDAALIADLRRQDGTPEEVFANPELLRITLDTLGADYRVCESFGYRESAPLNIPVHVLAGRGDAIEPACMAAWRQETDVAFSLDWFDGGHFFIRQQERQVLSALERILSGQRVEVPDAAPVAT